MAAAGFTFDVADYGSGTPGVFDLHTVVFANYEAIVVASDYGGWLRQDELDILNARSAEIIDYINTGNRGLVAFAESGSRPPDTTHDRFGFLPFLVSASPLNQGESGFTLTPEGIALGLVTSDVNGNFSHNVFTGTGGLDVIDRDPLGEILSLATRGVVTVCGVNSTDAELLPYQASGYRYLIIPAGSAPPAGFEQPGFDDSGWSVGGAAFGNASSGCPLLPAIQTDWPPGTELLVRRVVSAPAGTANLRVVVTINNDIVEPFFNGSLIGGSLSQLGCKAPDTNGISVPQALVQAGQNVVAWHLRNAGTNNFFDPRITSCVPVSPLTCPSNILAQTDPGQCSAAIAYPTPTVAGQTVTCDPPSGAAFLKGTTIVTCTATNAGGNSETCSFSVTVNDTEPPTLTCPHLVVANDPGQCSAAVADYGVKATDNCPDAVQLTCNPPPGSTFPKGATTVACNAADGSGNTNACSFTVTVQDQEAPRVACRPASNPSGKKIPVAGKNPNSGENPDGYYQLLAKDNCDANPKLYIADSASSFVAGPFTSGDVVKITQTLDVEPGQQPGPQYVAAHIFLHGDALLFATDADGNASSPINCNVPPPPK